MSIQVVARASQLGLQISPRQLFQHQTIAELAAVATPVEESQKNQEVAAGPVPLTPIQHWFFAQNQPDPHHWNLTVMFELQQRPQPRLLARAVDQLIRHHDSLRLRFFEQPHGWTQSLVSEAGPAPFLAIDLAALPSQRRRSALETAAATVQTSLDLAQGPLARVVLFDLGSGEAPRLLLVIHHLVIDGVSWRILLGDLQTAYRQLEAGAAPSLPAKTTSYKRWAEHLVERAGGRQLDELAVWLNEVWGKDARPVSRLPIDGPGGENFESTASTVQVALDAEETRLLLQQLPEAYHTRINDALLSALMLAFERWHGSRAWRLDIEGHGRVELDEELDVSRTTGWFTAIYPIVLDLGRARDPGEALVTIKEQLRRVPNQGIDFGLLRYLGDAAQVGARLAALPRSEVIFNYLGQFDELISESSMFRPANESPGAIRSPRAHRHHLLEIYGWVSEGQLRVDFEFSTNLHQRPTIASLAEHFRDALKKLIAHCCRSPEVGGFTPSDFPEAELDQQELDNLLAQLGS